MLTDSHGQILDDGVRLVHFKIYDAPISGEVLWNGEIHKLTINRGLVNTILGSKSSLETVDFNRNLYLEITVDANQDGRISPEDPPLLPRQMILPAVFSAEAASARGLLDENGQSQDWSSLFVNEAGEPSNNPRQGLIPGNRIRQGSLQGNAFADGAIVGSKLGEQSIESHHLAHGAVTASSLDVDIRASILEPGAIEGERLADEAVSIEKRQTPQIGEVVTAGGIAIRTVPPFGPFNPIDGEQLIPEAEVELTSTGSPVMVELTSGTVSAIVKRNQGNYNIRMYLYRQSGDGEEVLVGDSSFGFRDRGAPVTEGERRLSVPLSAFSFVDMNVEAGAHRYFLKISNNSSRNGGSGISEFLIMARELR